MNFGMNDIKKQNCEKFKVLAELLIKNISRFKFHRIIEKNHVKFLYKGKFVDVREICKETYQIHIRNCRLSNTHFPFAVNQELNPSYFSYFGDIVGSSDRLFLEGKKGETILLLQEIINDLKQ